MCFVAIYDSKKYVPGIKQSRSSAADDTQFSLVFNFIYTSILQVVECSPTHDPVFCITEPLLTSTLTLFISGLSPVCADYNFRSELPTSK